MSNDRGAGVGEADRAGRGELIDLQAWPSRAMARQAIVEYIAWYVVAGAAGRPGRVGGAPAKRRCSWRLG